MTTRAITPLTALIGKGDDYCEAWRLDTRDVARGLAGALFVSLPLLFTMEMWQIARTMPTGVLVALLLLSLVINRMFLLFAGFRHKNWVSGSDWWDVLVALGIGAFASAITLFVTGVVDVASNPGLAVRTIALETVATSMGAVVAINQLGSGDSGKQSDVLKRSTDLTVILGSVLGGFLFTFNVAPTQETKFMATGLAWWQVCATSLLSLAISFVVVQIAQFEERDLSERRVIDSPLLETAISYCIALLLSALLTWLFGYGDLADAIGVWLPQVVVLAYATSLGGAAGRLVL
ncbi:MAG: DUF2391 family protein [Sphingomicrobium sp.]